MIGKGWRKCNSYFNLQPDCLSGKLEITDRGKYILKITTLSLPTPKNFNFWRTVYSHGWCSLLPFSVDKEQSSFSRLLTLSDASLAYCRIASQKNSPLKILVSYPHKLTTTQCFDIKHQIASCLRLTEDYSEFYREVKRYPKYRWIIKMKAGRMLRAPSVFEDIVKMICTTNCSWALTTIIVENLVGELGMSFDGRHKSFPSPETLAGTSEQFLRKTVRAGYRSPFLLEFAEKVASGKIDVESWRISELSTDDLFKKLRSIKGVGEYAAGNILKLLGRYDYLGLDSWVRGKYYEMYHSGRTVSDRTIERRYIPYGKWRGLFFWMEMTKDWYDRKFPF
jgi:3-methyladenine DNA glycosylase/8-oxoguanine DNA glycosylase